MDQIILQRSEMYDHFQASKHCRSFFLDPTNAELYVSYYVSMYLLQDSSESLWQHRQRDFAKDPMQAYIEFWGVMQAIIIQQEAIKELYEVIVGSELDTRNLTAWHRLRDLRNECAGHPIGDRAPFVRSFMGRGFGNYATITYERRQQGCQPTHPRVPLGNILDAYADEAETQVSKILTTIKSRWP